MKSCFFSLNSFLSRVFLSLTLSLHFVHRTLWLLLPLSVFCHLSVDFVSTKICITHLFWISLEEVQRMHLVLVIRIWCACVSYKMQAKKRGGEGNDEKERWRGELSMWTNPMGWRLRAKTRKYRIRSAVLIRNAHCRLLPDASIVSFAFVWRIL